MHQLSSWLNAAKPNLENWPCSAASPIQTFHISQPPRHPHPVPQERAAKDKAAYEAKQKDEKEDSGSEVCCGCWAAEAVRRGLLAPFVCVEGGGSAAEQGEQYRCLGGL